VVPLTRDEPGGFEVDDDRIRLPPGACDRLATGEVRAVVLSEACSARPPSSPICGPWSAALPAGPELDASAPDGLAPFDAGDAAVIAVAGGDGH
jgi:hypothetical protein